MKFVELKELHAKVQVTLHCPIYNSMNMSKKSYGVWKLMFFSFVVSLQKCFCRNNGENLLELNTFQGREMGQPPARTALFIRQHKCDKIQPGPSMEGPDECIRTNSPPPYSTYLIPQNELILIAGKQNPWNKFIIIGLMILFGFISVLLRSCYGCKAR